MSPICDGCGFQVSDNRGGVQCGKASYSEHTPGYGFVKGGSLCRYDTDLKDFFRPRTGEETAIRSMSSQIKRQRDKIQDLEYKQSVLEKRLTSIDREGGVI